MCAGAVVYLEKVGSPSVGMRLARLHGYYEPKDLLPYYDEFLDEEGLAKLEAALSTKGPSPRDEHQKYFIVEQTKTSLACQILFSKLQLSITYTDSLARAKLKG